METATDLGFGINLIDTGFQRPDMAACYVMAHKNQTTQRARHY